MKTTQAPGLFDGLQTAPPGVGGRQGPGVLTFEPAAPTPAAGLAEGIVLRDYQLDAVDKLRDGIRDGKRWQVLCIPTGGGKTVVGAHFLKRALEKGNRADFIVDRISLVDQTCQRLAEYGVPHGMIQGDRTVGRDMPIRVVSSQTVERRGFLNEWGLESDLVIIDECHTRRSKLIKMLKAKPGLVVIGLTATPFTDGLGEDFDGIVNVTTTNKLKAEGWLTGMKVYHAVPIDMSGIPATSGGEWSDSAVAEQASGITGDITSSWVEHTNKVFGGPVKTIAFSATVAHGEELCRAFQQLGFNFQQVSYKDRSNADRAEKIEAFRRGEIDGLVSVEALAKGFDVVDIRCLIDARPYKKSLAAVVQKLGRGTRPAPGKEFCLVLDHAGNVVRFGAEIAEFYENGIDELPEKGVSEKAAVKPKEPAQPQECPECHYVMEPGTRADACPSCGFAFPRKKAKVEALPGRMEPVDLDDFLAREDSEQNIWLAAYVLARRMYDRNGLSDSEILKKAGFNFKLFRKQWPPKRLGGVVPEVPKGYRVPRWFINERQARSRQWRKNKGYI